jgi:thymidine phosphorylase
LPRAVLARDFAAPKGGWITAMQTDEIGRAAMALGAGRERAEDKIDFGAGITMRRRVGERVDRGDPLCTLRANDEARLQAGLARLAGVFTIGDAAPAPLPLVRQVIAA